MKYKIDKNKIIFYKPLKKRKNGIKILFYRDPYTEKQKHDYPVAIADIERNQREFSWPMESIKILEVLVEQPKFKSFPFIWYRWNVCEKYE